MNRIVLGTSALGSTVPQPVALKILEAAYDIGIRNFDTAPLYGAGYAPSLLSRLRQNDITISTKFGSSWEPLTRFHLKRLLRARSFSDIWGKTPTRYSNQMREDSAWWSMPVQSGMIESAVTQLSGKRLDCIFMHGPPVLPSQNDIDELRSFVTSFGATLGICSPTARDLRLLLASSDGIDCLQMHLDDVLSVESTDLQRLLQKRLWIHGVYSPKAHSRYPDTANREAACVEFAALSDQIEFVISSKSVVGLGRLARLSEKFSCKPLRTPPTRAITR